MPGDNTFGYDLGSGHRWQFDDDGDAIWMDPNCRAWHMVELRSGKNHRLQSGSLGDEAHLNVIGSLLCRECGAHGFIRDGEWVNA